MGSQEANQERRAALIEAHGLTKVFGALTACDHIDLAIRPGEIHALLGENGAGKSTLVKMLFGSLEPTAGEIVWKGEPVRVASPSVARKLGIGMVFQNPEDQLVTTVLAPLRGERDLAIGTLLGSAVYNILAILGTVMLVSPRAIDVSRELLFIDLPMATGAALACLPVFKSGLMMSRIEGLLFVAAYFIYMGALLLTRL